MSIINFDLSLLSYRDLQPDNSDSWDGHTNLISMFGQNNTQNIDVSNIKISLIYISDFICDRDLKNNREEDISFLNEFSQIIFEFISFLFKGGWNTLKIDINNKTLCELIKNKFSTKVLTSSRKRKSNKFSSSRLVEFTKLLPS